jgi:hypothetical protein
MMNQLMMLLWSTPWDAVDRIFRNLFQALIPIGICVILPIIVITLALRTRRHEIDKKTEVMMKAIENGAQLDPAFFESAAKAGCKEKTVKDKLMGYLTAACVTSAIGLLAGIVLTIVFTSQNLWNDEPGGAMVAILPCAILLAVGIAFFIVYAIGKKTWAKELAELDAKKPEE